MARFMLVTVVAAVLFVPAVADAGWTVSPPKGWKQPSAEQAAALQKSASEKFGSPNATVVMKQWLAPGNGGLLNVVHITMPLERTTTASELVNSIATGTAKTLDSTGLKIVKQTAAQRDKSGQIAAYATLASRGGFEGEVAVRLMTRADGNIELLTLACAAATPSTCRSVVSSMKLMMGDD